VPYAPAEAEKLLAQASRFVGALQAIEKNLAEAAGAVLRA